MDSFETGRSHLPVAWDGTQLRNVLDLKNTSSQVYADTACRSKKNEEMLEDKLLNSQIHRRKTQRGPMAKHIARANEGKSKVRSYIEHPFAHLKAR